MTGPLHDTLSTPPRRSDYGAVRLGRRDIDGLIMCAEHYGAPYDLLASALGAQPARLRGIVARWRRAGYAATGRLAPGPGLVLAHARRHDCHWAGLPRHPPGAGAPAELARIDTAQAGLLAGLEQLGADTSPAAKAYRERTFTRHAELHDQHTSIQAQLDELTATAPDQDPALLDELPHLASQLADAPAALVEALLNALDIQVLYRPEQHQATSWATLTDTTPATITALLSDPRVTATQTSPQQPGPPSTPTPNSELAQGPIAAKTARDHETAWREGVSLKLLAFCAVCAERSRRCRRR